LAPSCHYSIGSKSSTKQTFLLNKIRRNESDPYIDEPDIQGST
jgi:hypothetical protein